MPASDPPLHKIPDHDSKILHGQIIEKVQNIVDKTCTGKKADPDLLYSLHIMAVTLQVGSFAHPQEKKPVKALVS